MCLLCDCQIQYMKDGVHGVNADEPYDHPTARSMNGSME